MRKPIEKLARELAAVDTSKTLGQLALELDESVVRIADALDVLKILCTCRAYYEQPTPLTYIDGT